MKTSLYILSTRSHEDWRRYLLTKSFLFDALIRRIRSELGIPDNGLSDSYQIIEWEGIKLADERVKLGLRKRRPAKSKSVQKYLDQNSLAKLEVYKSIFNYLHVFHQFNLNFDFIRLLALGEKNLSFSGTQNIYLVTSSLNSLTEPGVYIKFTPELSNEELLKLKKNALEGYQTFSRIMDIDAADKARKIVDEPKPENLKIYEAVEAYLIQHFSHNPSQAKITTVFEQIATESNLSVGVVHRRYYSVVNNFNLPTTKQIKLIPS